MPIYFAESRSSFSSTRARVGRESRDRTTARALYAYNLYTALPTTVPPPDDGTFTLALAARTLGARPRYPLPDPPPSSPVVVLCYYTNMTFLVVGSIYYRHNTPIMILLRRRDRRRRSGVDGREIVIRNAISTADERKCSSILSERRDGRSAFHGDRVMSGVTPSIEGSRPDHGNGPQYVSV